jgi:predicted TIM-barrel fold metal-dependent hydrolase
MSLAGIHRSVLLPPACEIAGVSATEFTWKLFGDDPRFILGYSVPDDVGYGQIFENVARAKERFDVRVVKVYPSISRLDLTQQAALERVERILSATSQNGMIFMIHGGLSPAAQDVSTREFGVLRHLESVDWGLSKFPVIIAHCGAFGIPGSEARVEVFPRLSKMIDRYDNLMADVSGLDVDQLVGVFQSIDTARLVFGTDALYYPQWKSMANLCWAVDHCHFDLEEMLMSITSVQPARLFD